MKKYLKRILAGALAIMLLAGSMAGTGISANAATNYADTTNYEKLGELFSPYFKLGCAIQDRAHWGSYTANAEVGDAAKEKLLVEQFTSITFGNELKPAYNFNKSSDTLFKVDNSAKTLLNWCKKNNMPVRGHVLVWHSQVHPQIFAKNFNATKNGVPTSDSADAEQKKLDPDCLVDRDTLISRLKTYIYGVMEYVYSNGYADVIYAWDVVNEACEASGTDGMRNSYWYQIIGPDFLYYSFLYAREASTYYAKQYAADYGLDKNGDLSSILPELFYNDYNEWETGRTNAIIKFCTEMKFNEGHKMVKSDVINPNGDGSIYGDGLIDGFGMQGHITDSQSITTFQKALEKYNAAIPNVHITELDIGKSSHGEDSEYKQAKYYYDFFTMLVNEVKNGVKLTSVTLWGLTDSSSWRADSEPLIFRGNLEKKPAFEAMAAAAKGLEFAELNKAIRPAAQDAFYDFEPKKVGGSVVLNDLKDMGFFKRGSGHQAELIMNRAFNHTPDGATALKVYRQAQDATMRWEVDAYIGNTVKVNMWVKCDDTQLIVGFEDENNTKIVDTKLGDDWKEITFYYTIPQELNAASFYVETNGMADIFVDDVSIIIANDSADMVGKNLVEDDAVVENAPAASDEVVTEATVENSNTEAATESAETIVEEESNHSRTIIVVVILLVAISICSIAVANKKKNNK